MEPQKSPPKILRLLKVMKLTGLKRSTFDDKLNKSSPRHDPTFAKQIRLSIAARGRTAVGFVENEVTAWLDNRNAASRHP